MEENTEGKTIQNSWGGTVQEEPQEHTDRDPWKEVNDRLSTLALGEWENPCNRGWKEHTNTKMREIADSPTGWRKFANGREEDVKDQVTEDGLTHILGEGGDRDKDHENSHRGDKRDFYHFGTEF